jgi:hypothetical protein
MPGTGIFLRHARACRGHPDSVGTAVPPSRDRDKPGDDLRWISCISLVMAGHSCPKDGVLSHAYVPAIHVFASRP